MTPPSAQARRERAAAEAVEWLQRLDSGGMSAGERADFVEWLRESPIHVAETLRMGRLSAELRGFTAWARSTVGKAAHFSFRAVGSTSAAARPTIGAGAP